LAEGKIVAFEALARWRHGSRGLLSPDEFVPAAERTGAITSLDKYVLWEAAGQIQRWSSQVGPVGVSVNVSATRFAQHDLPDQVERVLCETGLPANALQLEITESAFIEDTLAAAKQIAQLQALGIRVAIDDFGAGQSSLSYLKHFTVDTIKIDRGLVAEMHQDPRTERLVSGLVRMFQGLQLEIVAEGVENAEQYVHLQSADCLLAQGYFIGRPASAVDTEHLLKGRRSPVGTIASLYLDNDWA
jgi:EAL domain-containing protein (putative c-di-GMP-specific phosphodiesterase class I)